MGTLLIGYDLNKEETSEDYKKLITAIKAEAAWWHHLDSTWLVKTTKTPVQMRDHLTPFLDRNDELLVIDVSNDAAAWRGFSEEGGNWLKNNL
ncbi:SinR family protein [Geomonas edaphica]|uniref:SinR family protein n=1 Tax=Geomonas edaphica TaxID=2570226 RepID=UPI0010A8C0BF|nr:SinR family protein [Geomonas edaphica]